MKRLLLLSLFLLPFATFAAGTDVKGITRDWGFSGPFGKYDKSSLQRGLQVYTEVCSSCHSLKYIAYRNLSDLGYNKNEIKAFASSFTVVDGPDDDGEMFERPGRPADFFVAPYANDNAARAANGGAYPPDLSLITKARKGGANYIYNLLNGYKEPPKNYEIGDGMYYNLVYPGNQIAMPTPIYDDSVEYSDGTVASQDQIIRDVTSFLVWAAEPELEKRKSLGIKVLSFLILITLMLLAVKRKIWKDIE
mgnify:CR=1 FL=1